MTFLCNATKCPSVTSSKAFPDKINLPDFACIYREKYRTVLDASKEFLGWKQMQMFVFHNQHAEHLYYKNICHSITWQSSGTSKRRLQVKNDAHGEVGKLNSGNVCCHFTEILLASLTETVIEMYRITFFKMLFYVGMNVVRQL
jgi:hypothetical protein